MPRKSPATVILFSVWLLAASIGAAQPHDDKERTELATALKDARISLEQGVSAGAREGKPISAKYEVDDGKLQLSVYTMKGTLFSEVIVDHKVGKVSKAEPITKEDDLKAAKTQSEAMAKAKRSLRAAAAGAVKENKGYRVVSVMPELRNDHPVAEVTLVKGTEWKTVSEKLD
jgi:hypothetical protein